MKAKLPVRCTRRNGPTERQLTAWARAVIADPPGHHATDDEAAAIASLLAEMEASR